MDKEKVFVTIEVEVIHWIVYHDRVFLLDVHNKVFYLIALGEHGLVDEDNLLILVMVAEDRYEIFQLVLNLLVYYLSLGGGDIKGDSDTVGIKVHS